MTTPRHARLAAADSGAGELVTRLLDVAMRGLPTMYRQDTDEFAFTRAAVGGSGDGTSTELRGVSTRYAAIVALGALWLTDSAQRTVLSGHGAADFTAMLIRRLPDVTNLGDAALICWAAAAGRHPMLPEALARLRALDEKPGPRYVVEAAWVVAALATARGQADVEDLLKRSRDTLLTSRHPGSPLFPHATAPGLLPWYRTHVACFADQVYPIQALARLHQSGDDAAALAAAEECATRICDLQGGGGQWWWHYDSRTGRVVEGYPVYSVHQHAMAPMALLDLAEAGGSDRTAEIVRGLRWMTNPVELGDDPPPMILDDAGLTWRKVHRGDPRKLVRAAQGLTTRAAPGVRLRPVERIFRPTAVDRECRPYEFGWLLHTWLGGLDLPADTKRAAQ
ncbi:hypothetical protein ABZ671_11965 [Micromonospora sp. NPDC006766]|uniref:hypothetical protein n=1 Tax=Micromonospora sp. NPDC006766 TaxID=3154778 RepID=UPI0034041C42